MHRKSFALGQLIVLTSLTEDKLSNLSILDVFAREHFVLA